MERAGRRWRAVLTAGAVVPCCTALTSAWAARPLPGSSGLAGVLVGLLDGAVAALRLTDGWLVAGGAVIALLGVAMVASALVPGRFREGAGARLLPGADAALDRRGFGALLRDATLRVPGIARARVRVRGRRAVVRAVLVFGDPAEARAVLTAELRALRDRLGLVRPPRLVIRIAPA